MGTAEESEEALHTVCRPFGGAAPDAIFMCAGSAKPKFYVELTKEEVEQGMMNGFWLQAWTAYVLFFPLGPK